MNLIVNLFETHTVQESVYSHSMMQWWACNSLMSPPLSEEAGCESREWIFLLLVFIA